MVTKSRVDAAARRIWEAKERPDDIQALRGFRDTRLPLVPAAVDFLSDRYATLEVAVAGRIKRLESVVRKCRRSSTRISALEDLVGFRIVVPTRELQELIVSDLSAEPICRRVRDYVGYPKADGYRAVHVVLEFDISGAAMRLEVQVRTSAQHLWSSASEAFGLSVKEGGGPAELRAYLAGLSASMSEGENIGHEPNELGPLEWDHASPHLVLFDPGRQSVRAVLAFDDLGSAMDGLLLREETDSLEAVLLLAKSLAVAEVTHVRFFPRRLVAALQGFEPPLPTSAIKVLLGAIT